MHFLGTALTSDQDSDALDHLGWRAASLRKKDIGAAGAVKRGNRAGNDHSRQTWMKLLGAADQLIAVHLRHQEVAQQQIDRAGSGFFYNVEGLFGRQSWDDAITACFEKEGSN